MAKLFTTTFSTRAPDQLKTGIPVGNVKNVKINSLKTGIQVGNVENVKINSLKTGIQVENVVYSCILPYLP